MCLDVKSGLKIRKIYGLRSTPTITVLLLHLDCVPGRIVRKRRASTPTGIQFLNVVWIIPWWDASATLVVEEDRNPRGLIINF
jgi:hypothetical protein